MLRRFLKEIFSWLVTLGLAMLVIFFVNTEIFAMVQVQQQSMEATLYAGDRLVVDRLGWQLNGPQRGDVVIFLPDRQVGTFRESVSLFYDDWRGFLHFRQPPRRFVKRVIALPGDEVDVRDGKVWLNGEELAEPYANGDTYGGEYQLPLVIPPGQLFVMGDNREVSHDSRNFGPISQDAVVGSVALRVLPLPAAGIVE